MIVLQTARLCAEICEPGEGRNRTVRFDRAGFISRVELDDVHEFCSTEPDNLSHPCSGGAGLCSEIYPGERFQWTLTHSNCVASISEVDSFIPDRVPIWTIDHIISPEVFHDFSIAPGESHAYTREWILRD